MIFVATSLSLVTAFLLAPWVRRLALARGAVERPDVRKRHAESTASAGGLAVMAGAIAGGLALLALEPAPVLADERWLGLTLGAVLLMAVGAYDDARPISAWAKLAAQVVAAALAVGFGLEMAAVDLPLSGEPLELGGWGTVASMFWIVLVVNAFNLIDGLDGLCVGVAAIAALALAAVAALHGQTGAAAALMLAAGACVGFLPYNRYPARQFLGDAGSLPLGYLLGAGGLWAAQESATGVTVVSMAVLALAVPLADTGVAILRRLLQVLSVAAVGGERERFELRLDGRPRLFTADRRHVHHRLLDRGYPHAVAVRILWTLSLVAGAATVAAALWHPVRTLLLALMIGLATYLVLFQLRYQELGVLRKGLLLPLFDQGILRRSAFHRVVDGTLAALAYAMAYVVAHRLSGDVLFSWMARTLPVAVAVELSAFQVTGLYRGAYRHAGVGEALRVIRSTALGSTAAAVGLAITFGLGWQELATYVLNGLLLVMLVLGSRVSFRVLDYFHVPGGAEGAPTLLYGAGRAGDLALRELLCNPQLGWRPVGFIDDNPGQRGRFRAGYPILGGLTELEQVVEQYGVKHVVVTTRKLKQARWSRLLEAAARLNLRVVRFTLDWEPVRVKAARRVSKPAQPVASAQTRAHQ